MESEERLDPSIRGPLYFVLLVSTILVSYFLGRYQNFNYPEITSPQVIGVSDVSASDTFQITKVTAKVDSPREFGCLYKQFNFWGEITSNGPGTASYEWEGESNSSMAVLLTFDTAETKYISTGWQVYKPGKRWVRLHVYSPNNIASSEVSFELECR
ncbi:MAG: hypothetical protein Q8L28_00395 [bacterium]|nr:hypothetical protein [bacterium]